LTAEVEVWSRALDERHRDLVGREEVITIQDVKVETTEAPLIQREVDCEVTLKEARETVLMMEQDA
jgi:hypothetical protein